MCDSVRLLHLPTYYLQELQELKCEYEDNAMDDGATDDDAPRDAFAVFARRHQPRTSLRYAAEQAGVLKAINDEKAKLVAAQKKARWVYSFLRKALAPSWISLEIFIVSAYFLLSISKPRSMKKRTIA